MIEVPAEEWAQLDRTLGELAASGAGEVREDGEWLAELDALKWEVHRKGKNSLIHLWAEGLSLTRRVLRVKQQSDDGIVLEVQRFGRAKPGRLEFLRTDKPRSSARVTREQFRARLARILAERFPDATADGLTTAPDLEHSFSGLYVRGRMREGSREWAMLAVSPAESAANIDGMLAFGLLWLDWTRGHAERRPVEGLRLLVPEGRSRNLRERALGISSSARVEIFEFALPDGRMKRTDPSDAGNLESWLVPRRETEIALESAGNATERVRALNPGAAGFIEARPMPKLGEVALLFRGLEFAHWTREGVTFGLGERGEKLTESSEPRLERLIGSLDLHRAPVATQTSHSLFRAAPERWLESLLLEDPTRLDASLVPGHLYSQVPALAAGDRGVLDLLGVTRRGRLVVIELKASENIQLPVQAVDYWLRVRRHQQRADFHDYGYFAGIELSQEPPLLWLVAPGLRFHPATGTLIKYLSPEIHVTRIGLNETWRRGVKVVFRQ